MTVLLYFVRERLLKSYLYCNNLFILGELDTFKEENSQMKGKSIQNN